MPRHLLTGEAAVTDDVDQTFLGDVAFASGRPWVSAPRPSGADDTATLQPRMTTAANLGVALVLGDGTYLAENLTASNVARVEVIGQGEGVTTLKLRDDNGQGGVGQVLVTTDVTALVLKKFTVHGNYANGKAGAVNMPLVHFKTTVATQGRKDFRVLIEDLECIESAKGYGQVFFHMHENSTSTFSQFSQIVVKRFRSTAHGDLGAALRLRGPAHIVHWEDMDAVNDGEFGFVAKGVPTGGSNGTAFSATAEVGWNHYIKLMRIRNVVAHRVQSALFTQMVKLLDVDGMFVSEDSINPYYHATPTTFTVDPATDIISATVPSGYGTASIVTVTSDGTPPAPLVNGTLYYVRDVVGNTFKLATTNGGAAINITDTGTGTHTVQFMGYTYDSGIKGDDNKHTPEDPSVHRYRNVYVTRSTPHAGSSSMSYEESNPDTVGRVTIEDCDFDRLVDFIGGYPGLQHSARRCTFRKANYPIAWGTSTIFMPRSGLVEECYFDDNWVGATFTRDVTVKDCKFKRGATFSFGGSVVLRILNNTWNIENTTTQILELSPPTVASGHNATAVVEGNRVLPGSAVQTQFRITAGRNLAAFQLLYNKNEFYTSTTGDANSTSLQILARDNKNFQRSEAEYPLKTLTNAANPSVSGGKTFITGGTTRITSFAGGIEFNRILLYIRPGETVGNTTSIVTRSAADITGPAVREFVAYGSPLVWYEL